VAKAPKVNSSPVTPSDSGKNSRLITTAKEA
jgi:hypothetical protein